MEIRNVVGDAVDRFVRVFERTEDQSEQRIILARYCAAIQPNFVQWLATSISAVRSDQTKEILRRNLYDEVMQDHPGMLKEFCYSARVSLSPEDVERSTKDLYYIVGDVFDRGYSTSVRKVAALAVMENASVIFIPKLRDYAVNLGGKNLEYTNVHGIADTEHAAELIEALDHEVEAQILAGHDEGFCRSAATVGAGFSAEFLANILSPHRDTYISL